MRHAALLAVMILLAGCGQGFAPTATTPNSTSTSTPMSTESDLRTTQTQTATVVDIIDGDTMDVRLSDGSIETVRLLGVDTPETSITQVSPEEWEGIKDTTNGRDWLVEWSKDATQYARNRLADQTVLIRSDPKADRRGYYGRLLVYIFQSRHAEISFNERLLLNGYARYYDSSFSQQKAYQTAEMTARHETAGVWDYTSRTTNTTTISTSTATTTEDGSGDIIIKDIHADAEGNDNQNLNGEYVIFENTGDEAVDLTGWTVSDEAIHEYAFPAGFKLRPGESVTLYTGDGTDTNNELYWREDGAVWNNAGDTVTVKNDSGDTVDTYTY
jgi:micrococcal nuclease